MPFGSIKELFRRVQWRVLRAADQALESDVGMDAKIEDRLKNGGQSAVVDDGLKKIDFFASPSQVLCIDDKERKARFLDQCFKHECAPDGLNRFAVD